MDVLQADQESAVGSSEIQELRRANAVLEDRVRTLERRLDESDAKFASTLERLVVEFEARLKGIQVGFCERNLNRLHITRHSQGSAFAWQ